MSRPGWMDRPHEFREDVDDCSMCVCGVPADVHDRAFTEQGENR